MDVVIEAGIDPSQCIAFGPGLEDDVSDVLPTTFTIQAKDSDGKNLEEGGDNFEVLIDGPNGPIKPEVKDNGDGTYTVDYAPEDAGNHTVNVLLDGIPIKDAPFHVNVNAGADFSKSFVERFTFVIRTRDRRGENRKSGGDKVTVTVKDPHMNEIEHVKVEDINDGTYLVTYSLPEDYVPGEYTISCQIHGKDIKGSPWRQIIN